MDDNDEVILPFDATPPATEDPRQEALFDRGEWWDEAWRGMPEFKQADLMPYKSIYVHFENKTDLAAFAKLVGQTITMDTPSIWYPEAEMAKVANKRWVEKPPLLATGKKKAAGASE